MDQGAKPTVKRIPLNIVIPARYKNWLRDEAYHRSRSNGIVTQTDLVIEAIEMLAASVGRPVEDDPQYGERKS